MSMIRTDKYEVSRLENENKHLRNVLQKILNYEKNPIRRSQYAGAGNYEAPDWIQTKDAIFDIVKKALKEQ